MSNIAMLADRNGRLRAVPNAAYVQPSPQSPYFGWMDESGNFFTLRKDAIVALSPVENGRMRAWTSGLPPIDLPAEEGFRLMKMLGWKEANSLIEV